jgi:hypothetical protein
MKCRTKNVICKNIDIVNIGEMQIAMNAFVKCVGYTALLLFVSHITGVPMCSTANMT